MMKTSLANVSKFPENFQLQFSFGFTVFIILINKIASTKLKKSASFTFKILKDLFKASQQYYTTIQLI